MRPPGGSELLGQGFWELFLRVQLKREGKWHGPVGLPHFKTKKNDLGSLRLTGATHVFDRAIQLSRLGRLRLKGRGYLPTHDVKILSATVSEHARRWFVSVQVELELPDPTEKYQPVVKVDLGIARLATVSDGCGIENPPALMHALWKIERLQRTVSRWQKGSVNRKEAVERLTKDHLRMANIRNNALHQATSLLATLAPALQVQVEPSWQSCWKT